MIHAVLSTSISNAFVWAKNPEYEETAKFCLMFDKFFDCMNTRRAREGKEKSKADFYLTEVTKISE